MKNASIVLALFLCQFVSGQDQFVSLIFKDYQCDSLYIMSHDEKSGRELEGWVYSSDTVNVKFSVEGGYVQVIDPATNRKKILLFEPNPTTQLFFTYTLNMSNGNCGIVTWKFGKYQVIEILEENVKNVFPDSLG